MPVKSKCLGCEKEAKTSKGWCSIECYRKNQDPKKNRGCFKKNQIFTESHKNNLGKSSKKWHKENPEKSSNIIQVMNTPEANSKKGLKKEKNPKWKTRISYSCPSCEKLIQIAPYKIKNNNKIFCSKECYSNYHSSGNHKSGRKSKWIEKECLVCKNKFEISPGRDKNNTARFCSQQCHGLYRVKHSNKKDTDIEILLENILKELNIKYEKQKIIDNKTISDFFIFPNICIYADGDYWHNLELVKSRDISINKYLKENNYIVLRFFGKQIKENPEKIKKEICVQHPVEFSNKQQQLL
jgi:very-short-patch-repair endonuclease